MPAFLSRDGESLPQGMPPAREQFRYTKVGCEISYTLRSEAPDTMHGREKSTDVMGRMAVAKVEDGHPHHDTKEFYWKGPVQGWGESDTEEQRKKL
jgi:hypothetical protein